jgi:hypothetical protein
VKLPLKNPAKELYANERALGKSPREAARIVHAQFGRYAPETGAATKLEKDESVRKRLGHLRQLDDEMLAARRERIERRLTVAAELNLFDFSHIDPQTKKPVIDWEKVKNSDYAVAISEFIFDADTGVLKNFKRDDGLAAVAQLRDLYGFKSASRHEHTGKGGGPITTVDLSNATDEQLATLESIFGPLASASADDAADPGGTPTAPAGS